MNPNRVLVCKWATIVAREKVYQTPEGLEIETNEHYEVSERRVFFEDVQLVTYHRERGKLYLGLTGAFSFGFLALILYLSTLGDAALAVGAVFGTMFGLPFLIAFLVRAFFGVDVITVFGRRSKAAIRFRIRKRRAREVYGQICAAVRAAQRAIIPAESPEPPLPDSAFPLPPAQ